MGRSRDQKQNKPPLNPLLEKRRGLRSFGKRRGLIYLHKEIFTTLEKLTNVVIFPE